LPLLIFLCFVLLAFLRLFRNVAPFLRGLGAPRVLFNFLQVTLSLVFFQITWPKEFLEFLEILRFFNLNIDIIQPECQFRIPLLWKFLLLELMPVILVIALWLFYAFDRISYSKRVQNCWRCMRTFGRKLLDITRHNRYCLPLLGAVAFLYRFLVLILRILWFLVMFWLSLVAGLIRLSIRLFSIVYDRFRSCSLHPPAVSDDDRKYSEMLQSYQRSRQRRREEGRGGGREGGREEGNEARE
jgi:hypothetical protein